MIVNMNLKYNGNNIITNYDNSELYTIVSKSQSKMKTRWLIGINNLKHRNNQNFQLNPSEKILLISIIKLKIIKNKY